VDGLEHGHDLARGAAVQVVDVQDDPVDPVVSLGLLEADDQVVQVTPQRRDEAQVPAVVVAEGALLEQGVRGQQLELPRDRRKAVSPG
jgi:hypothetical protein